MVIRSKISTPLPVAIPNIHRKTWLKILGVTLENAPDKWDLHFDEMISRAAGRLYITTSVQVLRYVDQPVKPFIQQFNNAIIYLRS